MSYQHILVAVDLTEESKALVSKAVGLAKALDAKVSFIHIDVSYAELYTGLIDINLAETQHQAMEASKEAMKHLVEFADYPIHKTLVSSGDLSNELTEAIENLDVNLVVCVCGHHQDFWSKLLSSTRQVINTCPIDVLVVPFKD
ncbi:universal stress protein [Aliivibrio fischeri]|uniref:universal stress protein n=1 Tax=Aliivibrio fischeri TaxID=668 RepID=UPI0006D260BF|nr:universal stress protein [Aliivibrio fischeri]USR95575.1 universal stress protein [Aliivibrio fischeri ATCC 7744 = JCM 18803 = DSM 507]GGK24954.1 universal stress protein [Aliivibrio fischeri]